MSLQKKISKTQKKAAREERRDKKKVVRLTESN
jgi:hypothetical protein